MNYELKVIVIHRGGPYGGHYHAYIRDDCKEGNWNLTIPEQWESEPTEVKDKEEEKKEEEAKKAEEEKKAKEEVKEPEPEEEWIDAKTIDWKSLTKAEKKKMNQKLQAQNKKKKQQQAQTTPKKKKEKTELDYTKCDFPIPYSDIELGKHWFDFNDSTVTPIMPGQL